MTIPPILFQWDGEAMAPASQRFAKLADEHFVIGERYPLVLHQDRSKRSHDHFFASVADAWANLPEDEDRFPTAEHLRKWALIKAGYADERTIVCGSKAEAQRVAAFVKPIDPYAVVLVNGPVVKFYTAQSQSMRAMGKTVFQDSKEAVFRILDELLGVQVGTTKQHAGRAA
ncbi:MAG: hypothetical protein MI753_12415 [Hyphomicrobiales bacterium]|nr:hypothetical protein [Hyphomicrobiales bacterium]